jgi:hypothetical protein
VIAFASDVMAAITDWTIANPWVIGVALALAGVSVVTAIWDARR